MDKSPNRQPGEDLPLLPVDGGAAQTPIMQKATTRRRMLKRGAAAIPVMVTLQSGNAWAISQCIDIPGNAYPGTSANTAITTASTFIQAILGVGSGEVNAWALAAQSGVGPGAIPLDGSAEDYQVVWLLATNGSCWVSFCNTPLADPMTSPDVCAGS